MGRCYRYAYYSRTKTAGHPEEKIKKEFWENPDYQEYKRFNGYHFSDKMSHWASSQMKNVSGEAAPKWGVEDVRNAFVRLGLVKAPGFTWGDAAYAANMAYADYYGKSLKSEIDVLRQAEADMSDPDGYSGKIFTRYLSDIMGKDIQVPWKELM